MNNWDAINLPDHSTVYLPCWGKENHYDFFFSSSLFPLSPKSFLHHSHLPCFSAHFLYFSPRPRPSYSLCQQLDHCPVVQGAVEQNLWPLPNWRTLLKLRARGWGFCRRIGKPVQDAFVRWHANRLPSRRPSSLFHYTPVEKFPSWVFLAAKPPAAHTDFFPKNMQPLTPWGRKMQPCHF